MDEWGNENPQKNIYTFVNSYVNLSPFDNVIREKDKMENWKWSSAEEASRAMRGASLLEESCVSKESFFSFLSFLTLKQRLFKVSK